MIRTRQLVLAGLAVTVVMWLLAGCGGSGGGPQTIEPMALTQARVPVVADAAGLTKVIIGFKQHPSRRERALVEGQGGKVSALIRGVFHVLDAGGEGPLLTAVWRHEAKEGASRGTLQGLT